MDKLKPKDIKIKARGKQIREYIEDKYGSLEEFSKVFGNSVATIEYYCRTSDLGSDDFRGKLVTILDKGIDELAPDKKTQIRSFVNSILHNYTKYRDEEDLETIEKVIELCRQEKMEVEEITMERNKAMCYFNDKRRKQAIEMLEEIVEKAYEKKFHYHWIYFSCDLAVLHSFMADHKKAEKIYSRLDIEERGFRDNEFKDKGLYKYYYSYGVLCNRIGKYNKAKWLFQDSLNYAWSDIYKGGSILGIGLSYKKKEQYEKALEYYFEALEVQPSMERKILILNNIAELYKKNEDYDTAMEYIDKALDSIDSFEARTNHIAYVTYLEIKFLKGETEETLEELRDWVTRGNVGHARKSDILIALNALINLAKRKKSYDYLFQVENLIMNIIYKNEKEAFIERLETCLGKISRIFYEVNYRGRFLNEKESM